MFQLDTSVFGNINSKADYDRQKAELMRQKQMGDLQMKLLQKQVNTPDAANAEQLLAKAIQLGGVQNLSPAEQAQLQAADIAQRTKQSVDPRGNIITNQSYFDLLGMPAGQAAQMPTSVLRGQGIVPEVGQSTINTPRISPTTQTVPNTGEFIDVASQPDLPMDGLPVNMVDPIQTTKNIPSVPMPDVSGLSPYKAEDVLADWKRENMKLQSEAAKTQAEKQTEAPKAEAAFNSMRDDTQNILNTIDKAVEQTSGWTSGAGSYLSNIPGSGAKNLESTLSTIMADSAFSTLQQMREASKTGGALGAISERELSLLQNARTALDQSQSPDQLKNNLENYRRIRTQALQNTAEAFRNDYGYYPKGLEQFLKGQEPKEQKGAISWEEYFK